MPLPRVGQGLPSLLTAALVMTATICWVGLVLFALQPLPLFDLHMALDTGAGWANGAEPYRAALLDHPSLASSGSGFVYPPYTLPVFATLEKVPFAIFAVVWQLAQLAFLAWLVWDLARPRSLRRLAVLAIAVVFFYPVISNLVLGQAGLATTAILWLSLRLIQRRQEAPGGLILGGASLLKLFPLAMVALLVLHRRWLAALAAGGAFVLAILLTLPFVNRLWLTYVTDVLTGKAATATTFPEAQSIGAAVNRLLLNNPFEQPLANLPTVAHDLGLVLALVVLAAVLVTASRRYGSNSELAWALLLAALPLTMPYSWEHYYVLSLPLLWLVASQGYGRRDLSLVGAAVFAYLALSLGAETLDHSIWQSTGWPLLLQVIYANASVLGALVLLVAGGRLARGVDRPQPRSLPEAA